MKLLILAFISHSVPYKGSSVVFTKRSKYHDLIKGVVIDVRSKNYETNV